MYGDEAAGQRAADLSPVKPIVITRASEKKREKPLVRGSIIRLFLPPLLFPTVVSFARVPPSSSLPRRIVDTPTAKVAADVPARVWSKNESE